jgi:lysozyme
MKKRRLSKSRMKAIARGYRRKNRQLMADLFIVALLTLLNPTISYKTPPPHIPDKVEIEVHQPVKADSIQLKEMEYYLRTHHVTDEGYNLIAQYNTLLTQRAKIAKERSSTARKPAIRHIKAKDRLLPAVKTAGGYWKSGHFHMGRYRKGPVIMRDYQGRIVRAVMHADTIVTAMRTDSSGTYRGQMDSLLQASGQGTYDALDGSHYEGFWLDDRRHGFGFESSPTHQVRVGEWKQGRFLGERLRYTNERIYGIDISRHQHEKGRRRYGINWSNLRITSLGHRHNAEGRSFPVSFVYIKSTEGTTIRNRYYLKDYVAARTQGIQVGAYHFFSLKSPALEQAAYFVNHTLIHDDDFPPVLDVEPTDAQIKKIGGDEELLRRIRTFLEYVERRTHKRPILYISQSFINRHMKNAADIKQKYNVWIARYGEFKPDVKLVYWQLSAEGRVKGITGPVDINVFNGYQGQWDEFVRTGFHR